MSELKKDIVGYIGAGLVAMMLIPQIIHTYKVKHVNGVSIYFIILNILIGIDFIIYSIFLDELPFLISEIIVLLSGLIFLFQYIYYRKNTKIIIDLV